MLIYDLYRLKCDVCCIGLCRYTLVGRNGTSHYEVMGLLFGGYGVRVKLQLGLRVRALSFSYRDVSLSTEE